MNSRVLTYSWHRMLLHMLLEPILLSTEATALLNESKRCQQLWINDTISEISKSYIKDRIRAKEETEIVQEKT